MQKPADIKIALIRKYPEPVVLVTTRDTSGNANVIKISITAGKENS